MSFDEEWAELRAEAAAKQTAAMQLNSFQAGEGPSGAKEKVKITGAELRRRAGKADIVRGDFRDADNKTMTETGQVGPSLKGFASRSAFEVFVKRWNAQMKYVEGLLQQDVAGALRATADDFSAQDQAQADRHKRASNKDRDLK
ncbi:MULTISPECIES: hypothetical protein [unclassified Streptomyces]|uniref:hypothetical protein n=1 Tax=unclassified Streptomyces TaxID=2593676 RepID=UPI002E139B89|nr:hypothetical protein OIE76_16275 [Streptomyces sp. NBC_01727]